MKSYKQMKADIRSKAIEWQSEFCNHNYSYGELIVWQNYFSRLAKRFGLVKEFRENGII